MYKPSDVNKRGKKDTCLCPCPWRAEGGTGSVRSFKQVGQKKTTKEENKRRGKNDTYPCPRRVERGTGPVREAHEQQLSLLDQKEGLKIELLTVYRKLMGKEWKQIFISLR